MPWQQLNLFYPNREDGWLIYYFHGDWEIAVAQNKHVKQGDLLAVAKQPISDEQMQSFFLGCGQFTAVGSANVALPDEVVEIWGE